MNQIDDAAEELIHRARRGDREALGELLEQHRAHLRAMAEKRISGKLATRIDASDVIQQTCLSAYGNFEKFQGDREVEFLAWLQKIHEQNIQNVIRDHAHAQKRAVSREQSFDAEHNEPANLPQTDQTTASQRAIRSEEMVQLVGAMEKLPEDQREAVRLRHLEGRSLTEIADLLQRSSSATAGLLTRGLENLRKHLPNSDS